MLGTETSSDKMVTTVKDSQGQTLVEMRPHRLRRLTDAHQPHLGSWVLEMDCEEQVKDCHGSEMYFYGEKRKLSQCCEHQVMHQHQAKFYENLEFR
jgi:hypothetical protein